MNDTLLELVEGDITELDVEAIVNQFKGDFNKYGLGPIPGMGIEGAAIATNIARGAGPLGRRIYSWPVIACPSFMYARKSAKNKILFSFGEPKSGSA